MLADFVNNHPFLFSFLLVANVGITWVAITEIVTKIIGGHTISAMLKAGATPEQIQEIAKKFNTEKE